MLSPRQIADRCGIGYRYVLNEIDAGNLRAFKFGNRLRVDEQDFETWLSSMCNIPANEFAQSHRVGAADARRSGEVQQGCRCA